MRSRPMQPYFYIKVITTIQCCKLANNRYSRISSRNATDMSVRPLLIATCR